jgi:glycosidase
LDVAQDIPHPFWIEWRKLVKSINPQAFISGEIWSWAQPWLRGNEFDAVMNYQFAMACQSFFVEKKTAISPSKFDGRLAQLYYNYPLQVVLSQMNLFDSHDTDRFATRFSNPDLGFKRMDRLQDNPKYDVSKPKEISWIRDRQAVVFQMSFAGSPMIYYGDEAGMWSPDDPSDRMPMWWKDREPFDEPDYQFNQDEFDAYQRAIAVRQQFVQLQTGSFHSVLIDDARGIYGFARGDGPQTVYVVINRSPVAAELWLPVEGTVPLVDWLDARSTELMPAAVDAAQSRPTLRLKTTAQKYSVDQGTIHLSLAAYGSAILTAQEP